MPHGRDSAQLYHYATSGLSTLKLARKYNCHHATIITQAKKHGVKRGIPTQIQVGQRKPVAKKETPPEPNKAPRYEPLRRRPESVIEIINKDKTYAEYLRDYERRMKAIRKQAMRRARETLLSIR